MTTFLIALGSFIFGCLVAAFVIGLCVGSARSELEQEIIYLVLERDYYKEKYEKEKEENNISS